MAPSKLQSSLWIKNAGTTVREMGNMWLKNAGLLKQCTMLMLASNAILKPRLHDTTCCQTGLTTGCIVYTNIQPVVKPV